MCVLRLWLALAGSDWEPRLGQRCCVLVGVCYAFCILFEIIMSRLLAELPCFFLQANVASRKFCWKSFLIVVTMNYAQLATGFLCRTVPCPAPSSSPCPLYSVCALFNAPLFGSLTLQVKYEGRMLYLTCVCMSCLDGTSSSRVISCR